MLPGSFPFYNENNFDGEIVPIGSNISDIYICFMDSIQKQERKCKYEIFIRTTPERLWQAITDGDPTQQYFYHSRAESSWQPGASYVFRNPQGEVDLSGKVLESDPPRRLVTTFSAPWMSEATSSSPSIVTWEITPAGETCKLALIHDNINPETFATGGLHDGWLQIISGLKTFLETGQPLVIQA